MSLVNRFSTSEMELVSKFSLSYLLKWTTMARMSTFLDQLTNYVKFEIEVLAANRKKEAARLLY